MDSSSLNNYLRTYRKRSGLTQGEVAFLLGCKDAGLVSRYERRHRLPTLRMALACASILRVPLEKLFAGIQREVDREASDRLAKLRSDLEAKSLQGRNGKPSTKKLRWLTQVDGSDHNVNEELL
jgi:transcriptional regulator with XRE-family HTH domain